MNTAELAKKATNKINANNTNPVTQENNNPRFVAGNTVNKDSAKPAEAAKPQEAPKAEPAKGTETAQPAKAETPKTEPDKVAEAPQPAPVEQKKIVLNLEGTLKFIEEKHRLIKQRDKLNATIKNLDEFEIELRDEADTTDTNYYNGCVLTIQDDKRNTFETKNPTIIWAVAQMVNRMCVDKLAEIEAGIVLP